MDQASTLREMVNRRRGDDYPVNHGQDLINADFRTIAVTSGKGGVGKTNVVVNLAYQLTRIGKKVIILDADLGMANIDVLLGLKPKYNLLHVLSGNKNLDEIMLKGPGGVEVLPASSGVEDLASLADTHKFALLAQLAPLGDRADFVLIDTAAGISSNVLFFAYSSRNIIVVLSPEPTSIANAYALIKVLAMNYRQKKFRLIANNVKDQTEAQLVYAKIESAAKRFLGLSLDFMGHVVRDANLERAVRRQTVVTELYPQSDSSRCFGALAKKLCETFNEE